MHKIPPSDIVRSKRGREVKLSKQVMLWRKRMRRFKALKGLVLASILEKAGGDAAKAKKWLTEPNRELYGKPPKERLNPEGIAVLKAAVDKVRHI